MNNYLRRILTLLAVLALTAGLLTGCGQPAQGEDNQSQTAQDSTAQDSTAQDSDAQEPDAPEESASQEETPEGEKHITLTVTYEDETSQEYAIDTTAQYLKEAIEGEVELGGSDSEYGFYLESVNGVTADYDADGAYWAIYVNDEYGMYGLDTQPVTDGDHYALVYTVD